MGNPLQFLGFVYSLLLPALLCWWLPVQAGMPDPAPPSSRLTSKDTIFSKEEKVSGRRIEGGNDPAQTAQGTEIILNGQKFPTAWAQWHDGTSLRIGISDTGLMQLLGLELLDTNQPTAQPARWFSSNADRPPVLPVRLIPPYRYLDVTALLEGVGAQLQASGSTLRLDLPPAQIASVREGNQIWGKRIVIDLSRPTAWQVSQARSEGVVTIVGRAATDLLARFPNSLSSVKTRENEDKDDIGNISGPSDNSQLFSLENTGTATKVKVNLPAAHSLRVFSLTEPPRIVIDVRPDVSRERQIAWAEGLTWHQQLVRLGSAIFPVNWLEVNLGSSRLTLKPMTSNPSSQTGIAPLVTTARDQQAVAAINGGFFNRNNKLPLGAIRRDGVWLSGPILNRGAIAWNERGEVKIGRLSRQETLVTTAGKRLAVSFLNSGYVTGGIARYTTEWGAAYTPLSDGETIISVQGDRVTNQQKGGKAGSSAFPIPANGYLLTFRKNSVPTADLAVGRPVKLETTTVPADFANYPQIVGAGPLLLLESRIVLNAAAEKFSPAFEKQQASRSAIGITSQGTLIVAAAHNRIGGRGASLGEMAQIMQQLGSVAALNLDGGSSTSLFLGGHLIDRSPVTAARVHNGIGIFISP